MCATITGVKPLFEQAWPTSAAVFLPGGNVPKPGGLFQRPALAATYERVCKEAIGPSREARIEAARDFWYKGYVAECVGKFFANNNILDASKLQFKMMRSSVMVRAGRRTVRMDEALTGRACTNRRRAPALYARSRIDRESRRSMYQRWSRASLIRSAL